MVAARRGSLLDLCCREVAVSLLQLPCSLQALPPRVQARILECAISIDQLENIASDVVALSKLSLIGSRMSDHGLSMIARACGALLIELDISRCIRLHDRALCAMLESCPRLCKLNLSHCRFSDISIECAARCCAELRELEYSWNGSGIGDKSIWVLAAHCPQLEAIALSGSSASDAALLTLACAHPKLMRIEVRGCHLLSEGGIVAALSKLPLQTKLELCHFPRVSEASIELLTSQLQRIEVIDFSMCDRISDSTLAFATSGLPMLHRADCYGASCLRMPRVVSNTLRHLCLSGCRVLTMPHIVCPKLETLELQNCRELTADAVGMTGRALPVQFSHPSLTLSPRNRGPWLELPSSTLG